MDREVGRLVEAFRSELEGCHGFLDETGCPRTVNGRPLTLKDRIQTLVLADHQYGQHVDHQARELRALKQLLDRYDELGVPVGPEAPGFPLTDRVHGAIAELLERLQRTRPR